MSWRSWLDRITGRGEDSPSPQATAPTAPASRGLGFALLDDTHGDEACVGCSLCAQVCPVDAIALVPGPLQASPRTGHRRGWVDSLSVDPRVCIGCELCMQVCPTDALRLFPDPAATGLALLDQARLRAAALQVRGGRRRSPLGPMPVEADQEPSLEVRPAARPARRRPRPALGLDLPSDLDVSSGLLAHPQLTKTDEPTRLEQLHHPEEAPTDADSDVYQAADPGDWVPGDWTQDQPEHLAEQHTAEGDEDSGELSDLVAAAEWLDSEPEPEDEAFARRRRRGLEERAVQQRAEEDRTAPVPAAQLPDSNAAGEDED